MSLTSAYRTRIRTGSADDNAILLLSEGTLVAILVELADDGHGSDRGRWIVETSFGIDADSRTPMFETADKAASWVSGQIGDIAFRLDDAITTLA